jgi:hypothetical protein
MSAVTLTEKDVGRRAATPGSRYVINARRFLKVEGKTREVFVLKRDGDLENSINIFDRHGRWLCWLDTDRTDWRTATRAALMMAMAKGDDRGYRLYDLIMVYDPAPDREVPHVNPLYW